MSKQTIDSDWTVIGASSAPGNGSYNILATTGDDLQAFDADEFYFGVFINTLSTMTNLKLRFQGSMDGTAFYDVLAAFADSTDVEVDGAPYVLNVTDTELIKAGGRFRVRFDERWKYWRILGNADAAGVDLVISARRA